MRTIVDALGRLPDDTWLIHTALAYCYLGLPDTARALTELERAVAAREITPSANPLAGRMCDVVRTSPRFAGVVRGFGLDVLLLTSPSGGRPAR